LAGRQVRALPPDIRERDANTSCGALNRRAHRIHWSTLQTLQATGRLGHAQSVRLRGRQFPGPGRHRCLAPEQAV